MGAVFLNCVRFSIPHISVQSTWFYNDFKWVLLTVTLISLGAFLIPYFITLVLLGIPLFFLELAIGQRLRQGHVGVWKTIHPYLGGVGVASAIVSLFVCMYYNMLLGWCFFYLFGSFQDPLPYSSCPLGPNCTVNEQCKLAGRTRITGTLRRLAPPTPLETWVIFQWHLCLVLLVAWIALFFFVNRGVQSIGKVSCVISSI